MIGLHFFTGNLAYIGARTRDDRVLRELTVPTLTPVIDFTDRARRPKPRKSQVAFSNTTDSGRVWITGTVFGDFERGDVRTVTFDLDRTATWESILNDTAWEITDAVVNRIYHRPYDPALSCWDDDTYIIIGGKAGL